MTKGPEQDCRCTGLVSRPNDKSHEAFYNELTVRLNSLTATDDHSPGFFIPILLSRSRRLCLILVLARV